MNNYTIQTYKKNETIYCEGEAPSHLMCLITGKVKIFKDGVGGRSQIIRMIKLENTLPTAPILLKKHLLQLPQHSSPLWFV
ncbi:transcriptional regulator [Bacteroides reticulotermitis JCM 10512]|uniref:Transcriptional regulator n=1 Tax=Bacteroides reticulotermitis JCM 10512 TaxID=1445607 RepID=W4UPP6_9BACE|nr:transcriptional regulator [Bacteroides reticulotermitis JCM 10512]